jgi:glycolate oxidase FAD binding subunit
VRLALERSASAVILRIAVLPASAAALAENLAVISGAHDLDAALAVGSAGSAGTGYVALWPRSESRADAVTDEAQASFASAVKELLEAAGSGGAPARAFVECCPTALKRRISLWGAAREDFELMQRVKKIFDPHGVLAPGRYCGGL